MVAAGCMEGDKPYTMEQECFLCQLDTQAKQLGSPSGYDEQAASDCASITSGCAATKYTYEISRAKLPTLPLQVCPGQYATLAGITPSKMATCATRLPRRRAYRLRPSSTSLTLMRATTGFLLLVRISAFYCLAHSTKSTSVSSLRGSVVISDGDTTTTEAPRPTDA